MAITHIHLTPEDEAALLRIRALPESPPLPALGVEGARAYLLRVSTPAKHRSQVDSVEDLRLASGLRARRYTHGLAVGPEGAPGIVFFHGGGFVIGDLETHDELARRLAIASGAVVVAVDYRLAPEHPFPAAVDDAAAALADVRAASAALGIDATRLGLAGDSAGANLALVTALCDRGPTPLRGLALAYPAVDRPGATASYRAFAHDAMLRAVDVDWFFGCYARSPEDLDDPRLCPARSASVAGLPATLVLTAEHDVLRDEGERFGARLADEGVAVTRVRYDGMPHGFLGLPRFLHAARDGAERMGTFLRGALG